MFSLKISPEADSDLREIQKYISFELENPSAAQNVVSNILKAVRSLEMFPDRGNPLNTIVDIKTDYRFLVSGKYIVFYRTDDKFVYIIRILYGKRDYIRMLFPQQFDGT